MENVILDIITIIISVIALGFSLYQFFCEAERQKKEATLNAYKELQETAFSVLRKYQLSTIKKGDDGWDTVTTCMAQIENFCVGVNSGVYSLDILNRLGGGFFIERFEKLQPVIQKKRSDDRNSQHYNEFSKTVRDLKKKRSAGT